MLNAKIKEGVGVIVVRDNRVLLGLRKGAHGADTWAFPGGKPKFYETVSTCAIRELTEETSMVAEQVQKVHVTVENFFQETGIYWLTHFVTTCLVTGEPKVCEPDKCAEWGWFEWNRMPEPLFAPLKSLVDSGYIPPGIIPTA